MSTRKIQIRAVLWVATYALLFGGCSSTQQQQDEPNENVASESPDARNNSGDQSANYGTQSNNGADNGFDNLGENTNGAGAKTANSGNATGPMVDDSELINSAPLDLGSSEAANTAATASMPTPEPASQAATPTAPNFALKTMADGPAQQLAKPEEIEAQRGALWWIAYDFQRKDKAVRVQMITKGRPQFDIFQEQNKAKQQELIVRFYNTTTRPKMRRSLDATEFRSPVVFIRTREDLSIPSVDVILTLREPVKPILFAKRGNVQLTFPINAKYFATNKRIDHPEYVAQNIEAKPQTVVPELAEGSELPRSKLNAKVYVPNPVGDAFSGEADHPTDPSQLKPSTAIPGQIDAKGLPVSDYVAPDATEMPADSNAPANQVTPEITIPTQGAWPGMESFSLLAVAQENYSLGAGNGASKPAGDEFATPNAAPEKLDLGSNANAVTPPMNAASPTSVSAPAATEVISESSVPPTSSDVSSLDPAAATVYTGKPIVLEFYNAPLGEVLKAFSEQIGTNFIYSPEIGRLSVGIKLKNVPWDAALDAILQTYQLGMAKLSDNVIRIDKTDAMAQYLLLKDRAEQAKILSEPRKVVVVRLSNAKADDQFANRILKFFEMNGVDNRTRISVDPRTNTVFIEAPPTILQRAKALIEKLDVPEPQVEVVSRLIEVSRQARNFLGISWNGGLNFDAGRGLSGGTLNFPNNANSNFTIDPGVNATNRPGAINFNLGSINDVIDLGLRLKMEESKGTAEILQSNRVIVADREAANISAGQTAYYRVTQSPIFIQPTQQQGAAASGSSGSSGIASASFSLSLSVTPEVTNDGHVRMNLRISSEVPSPQPLSGADISTNRRELTTILKKRSGDTAVIGGIYDTRKSEQEVGIPFLSHLPILGALFRSKSTSEDQTELMMMITPSIVGKDGEPVLEGEAFAPAAQNSGSSGNLSNNTLQQNASTNNAAQGNTSGNNAFQEGNSSQGTQEEAL